MEVRVRLATAADAATIFSLICALADYEKLSHEVVGNAAAIAAHSSGDRPYIATLLAEVDEIPVGLALFFPIYSIRAAAPGFYLEDLFVLPSHRRTGIGRALLAALAQYTLRHGFQELRWSVLDWNEPAIAFYRRIGAVISEKQRICRTTGDGLAALAASALDTRDWHQKGEDAIGDHAENLPAIAHSLVRSDELCEVADTLRAWATQSADRSMSLANDLQDQVDALIRHGTAQPPRFELLQITSPQGQRLGLALLNYSYSTFLTQPGLLVEATAHDPHMPHAVAEHALHRALAHLALERQCGRLEWYVNVEDEAAIARYCQRGAITLPDWRICRSDKQAIAQLAESESLLIP